MKFYDLTKSKTPELDRLDNLEEYRGKWVNLYFFKCGASDTGENLFDTEQKAYEAGNDSVREYKTYASHIIDGEILDRTGKKVICNTVSHFVSMPTGGA